MAAGKYNFVIEQGAECRREFSVLVSDEPYQIENMQIRMQVRESFDAADALLDLTTENGGIEIMPDAGKFAVKITSNMTEGATWRRGVYDIEIVAGVSVLRLVQGVVRLSPEVTR